MIKKNFKWNYFLINPGKHIIKSLSSHGHLWLENETFIVKSNFEKNKFRKIYRKICEKINCSFSLIKYSITENYITFEISDYIFEMLKLNHEEYFKSKYKPEYLSIENYKDINHKGSILSKDLLNLFLFFIKKHSKVKAKIISIEKLFEEINLH